MAKPNSNALPFSVFEEPAAHEPLPCAASLYDTGQGARAAEDAEERQRRIVALRDGEDVGAEQSRGWRDTGISGTQLPTDPVVVSRVPGSRRLELPGKNGRRNPDEQPLTPAQAQEGLSDEEIDRRHADTKRGSQLVRAALDAAAHNHNR